MVISSQPDMELVAEASNGRSALQCYRDHRPDMTIMDLRLPGIGGVDATIPIQNESPDQTWPPKKMGGFAKAQPPDRSLD